MCIITSMFSADVHHYINICVEKSPSIKVHRVTDPPPPPFFSPLTSKFNFSRTVGEMVLVSFEIEKMRMFLVQSVVRWYRVLVRSRGAVVSFPV